MSAIMPVMSELRDRALAKLGNKCRRCGFTDKRALQIDHINSDGKQDRAMGITGPRLHNAVLRDDGSRYQLLCANCNWIKRVELGEGRKITIYHDELEHDSAYVSEAIGTFECGLETLSRDWQNMDDCGYESWTTLP